MESPELSDLAAPFGLVMQLPGQDEACGGDGQQNQQQRGLGPMERDLFCHGTVGAPESTRTQAGKGRVQVSGNENNAFPIYQASLKSFCDSFMKLVGKSANPDSLCGRSPAKVKVRVCASAKKTAHKRRMATGSG